MSSNERRTLHRNGAKLLFGDKCQKCGYDKHWEILEWHHIVPRELTGRPKVANIFSWKWERIRDELLEHCTLLCPNCHKETHLNDEENNSLGFGVRWIDPESGMDSSHKGTGDRKDKQVLWGKRVQQLLGERG